MCFETSSTITVAEDEIRPLVSFALFAYNQEKFIEAAVRSALNQDYPNLQIILSDDCSKDRTFSIIQELASAYDGPHKLVVNKNDQNLGVGAHVNKIVKLAEGDLIVAAAGDDISTPDRAKVLTKCWLKKGCPSSIFSNVYPIDAEGRGIQKDFNFAAEDFDSSFDRISRIKHFALTGKGFLLGCSAGWSKTIFINFGQLSDRVVNEDQVIAFRSLIESRIGFCEDRLVKYRFHDENLHSRRDKDLVGVAAIKYEERLRAERARRKSIYLRQNLSDLEKGLELGFVTESIAAELRQILKDKLEISRLQAAWIDERIWKKVLLLLRKNTRENRPLRRQLTKRLFFPIFCLAKGLIHR